MASQRRTATKAKMLFECDRRPAQIEIGIGQKVGEYSLTFSLQAGLVQGRDRGCDGSGGAAEVLE